MLCWLLVRIDELATAERLFMLQIQRTCNMHIGNQLLLFMDGKCKSKRLRWLIAKVLTEGDLRTKLESPRGPI